MHTKAKQNNTPPCDEEEGQQAKKKHPFLKKDSRKNMKPVSGLHSKESNDGAVSSVSHKHKANKNLNSNCHSTKEKEAENKKQNANHSCKGDILQVHGVEKNKNEPLNRLTFGNNEEKKGSYLSQIQFQVNPELVKLWKTQIFEREILGESYSIRTFSQGRKEIKYEDGSIQVLFNDLKLTRWANGDFKLVEGDKVSFWSEQNEDLDQYFIS